MSSYANIPNIKEQTGWRVPFWFAVSSPLVNGEEAMSTTPIVFICSFYCRFRFNGRVRTQLALKIARENIEHIGPNE